MAMWTCPACGRPFGREGQGHTCVPAMTLDGYFAARPPAFRATCDAIIAALEPLGDLTVEAVSVGIFFKKRSTFADLRPRRDHQVLGFVLPFRVDDARISRALPSQSGRRIGHLVPLRSAEEVDATVRGWLAQAYEFSP